MSIIVGHEEGLAPLEGQAAYLGGGAEYQQFILPYLFRAQQAQQERQQQVGMANLNAQLQSQHLAQQADYNQQLYGGRWNQQDYLANLRGQIQSGLVDQRSNNQLNNAYATGNVRLPGRQGYLGPSQYDQSQLPQQGGYGYGQLPMPQQQSIPGQVAQPPNPQIPFSPMDPRKNAGGAQAAPTGDAEWDNTPAHVPEPPLGIAPGQMTPGGGIRNFTPNVPLSQQPVADGSIPIAPNAMTADRGVINPDGSWAAAPGGVSLGNRSIMADGTPGVGSLSARPPAPQPPPGNPNIYVPGHGYSNPAAGRMPPVTSSGLQIGFGQYQMADPTDIIHSNAQLATNRAAGQIPQQQYFADLESRVNQGDPTAISEAVQQGIAFYTPDQKTQQRQLQGMIANARSDPSLSDDDRQKALAQAQDGLDAIHPQFRPMDQRPQSPQEQAQSQNPSWIDDATGKRVQAEMDSRGHWRIKENPVDQAQEIEEGKIAAQSRQKQQDAARVNGLNFDQRSDEDGDWADKKRADARKELQAEYRDDVKAWQNEPMPKSVQNAAQDVQDKWNQDHIKSKPTKPDDTAVQNRARANWNTGRRAPPAPPAANPAGQPAAAPQDAQTQPNAPPAGNNAPPPQQPGSVPAPGSAPPDNSVAATQPNAAAGQPQPSQAAPPAQPPAVRSGLSPKAPDEIGKLYDQTQEQTFALIRQYGKDKTKWPPEGLAALKALQPAVDRIAPYLGGG